jgi:hypothetical protein
MPQQPRRFVVGRVGRLLQRGNAQGHGDGPALRAEGGARRRLMHGRNLTRAHPSPYFGAGPLCS